MNTVNSPILYRPDIDGLRAVSVFMVVIFHAFPAFAPGGFSGVDVFYVISGYLISSIIFEKIKYNEFSLIDFYFRRIRRIFPAIIIVILFCIAMGWLILNQEEYEILSNYSIAGIGFYINSLLSAKANYFDEKSELTILLNLWSISVEEQFYIFFPIIAIIYKKFMKSYVPYIVMAASLIYNVYYIKIDQNSTFFLSYGRIWELLAGTFIYDIQNRVFPIRGFSVPRLGMDNLQSLLGVGFLVVAFTIIGPDKRFPGWWALLPVLGAVFIILAGPQAWLNRVVLSHPGMVALGLISYPLYLWHWPLLVFGRLIWQQQRPPALTIGLLAAAIFLAWATFRYVEIPIRRNGGKRSVAYLVALALGIVGCAGLILANDGFPERRPDLEKLSAVSKEKRLARSLYPTCGPTLSPTVPIVWCYKSKDDAPSFAVFGDSHAHHLFLGLAAADRNHGWVLMANPACPPLLGVTAYLDNWGDVCRDNNVAVIDRLGETPSIQTVIIAFLAPYYMTDVGYAADHSGTWAPANYHMQDDRGGKKSEILQRGLDNTISTLERAGKQVVISLDTPEMPVFPQDCVKRLSWLQPASGCVQDKNFILERQAEYRVLIKEITRLHPHVRVYDPLPVLCPHDKCPMIENGTLLYRDSHHLSLLGSRKVATDFLNWLSKTP